MNISQEPKFDPSVLYDLYKQARNHLRKYNPDSVVAYAIEALHKAAHGGYEVMRYYQPWNILLAIKWTFQEADSVSSYRPPAKIDNLHKVLNILQEMGAHVRMPTEYEHHHLFMRHLAFQQFWLQHTVDAAAIARQKILFCTLPENHPFQRDFVRLTGICCEDFILLSFTLTALFLTDDKRRSVRRENFSNLSSHIHSQTIDSFLSKISADIPSLHKILGRDSERKHSIMDQMILQTPLLNFPLLKVGPDHIPYYPTLLFRSLENFIYRTLKTNDPSGFQDKFGFVFEKYVKTCLSNVGIFFMDESELNLSLGGRGKCVDFLIVENDCNILIDAKGVEASQLGRVAHDSVTVFKSVKSSVQKGIKQGMETARRIAATQPDPKKAFGKSKNFLLIVTYDTLNLGSNTEFSRIFGQKIVDDLQQKFGNPLPIPIHNIFWIDIDEFERLLARVHEKQTTIVDTLVHAQNNDSNSATQKFYFSQHLESLSPQLSRIPLLQTAFDTLFNDCTALLKDNAQH